MIIAEVEDLDARTSGSTLGWQTLQRLKSLGPSPEPASGLGRARRRLLRRVKRTDSNTSQRPFLIRHSVAVEDGLHSSSAGKGKMPAQDRMQTFETEKAPTGAPPCSSPRMHRLSARAQISLA